MATAYSAYSGGWKPRGSDIYKKYRARLDYWLVAETATYVQYQCAVYLNLNSSVSANYTCNLALSGTVTSGSSGNGTITGSCKTVFREGNTVLCIGTTTYTFYKTTYGYNRSFTAGAYCSQSKWKNRNWVYAGATIYVPPLASYSVSYNANGGEGTVASQTKWYGVNLALQSAGFTKIGWSLKEWNTMADGSGTAYALGGTYTGNSAVTLYAIWQAEFPPTADIEQFKKTNDSKAIKYFGKYVATFNVTNVYDGEEHRTATAKLVIGEAETTPIAILNGGTYQITSDFVDESGTLNAYLFLEDSVGATTQYNLTHVEQSKPVWERTFHITDAKVPDLDSSGNADVKVSLGVGGDTEEYVEYTGKLQFTGVDYDWYMTVPFAEEFVDDVHDASPNVAVKIEYTHTDTDETESRKAFYNTTRNQNFSNGIYSVMFVGGVIPEKSPSYASRVWWCDINDPLYFPDTNYAEVGSNDTRVMGLCKVGDYLGVVKQSKTTDTGVYLLYPTSFDDDTAFAQKQGIQGIGAIAKYSFNILGDETLFLSPEGVMAIRPDGDESHKVVNRSFFVDGRLLAETSIEEAYSFVFDGKYWLSIGDHCYVLDGNQQSSWGNDRTNLVLECYYLENVPAACFMKMGDELWFSNEECVCRFKNEHYSDQFTDAYEYGEGRENVPVKAEWSTILDDDGTLSYYKTMQKKGAVVSLLPETLSPNGTRVFVKKDTDEPVEIEREFSTHEGIPNEVYINKKFKKYRRLQFIVRNEEAEPMGINSIVKMYTVGNYAKGR